MVKLRSGSLKAELETGILVQGVSSGAGKCLQEGKAG